MRQQVRAALAIMATVALGLTTACREVPPGFGSGLPSTDPPPSTDKPTEVETSTDDTNATDTSTDSATDDTSTETVDTTNERTDPNQWPGYTWTYHRLEGCHGELDYHTWIYDGQAEATLVFVNGRTEYTDKYHHIVNLLNKPWNIIMFDHYGHGRSEGVRTWVEDNDTYYVCDMKKIVDEVATPLGLPLLLLAHSMGAAVATRFLQLHDGVFLRASLSSPGYLIDSGDIPSEVVLEAAEEAIADGKSQEAFRPQPPIPPCETNMLTHDCALYDQFKEDPLALIGDPTYGWIKASYDTHERALADAALIKEKIYIMQPGDERVVVEEEQDKLCDALNQASPDFCTLEVYPGDWHELLREVDRERVMNNAVEFLAAGLK